MCCIITPCYLRPPCLCGRSQQQSRHLVLDLQLVVPLLLLRNHLLRMLLYLEMKCRTPLQLYHQSRPKAKKTRLSPEEDYPFVEKPSEDFFCPVTLGLLLQPHLTSCCGKHLSEESATRIQGEGGPCPLCKAPDWSTVLNKLFRRQVKELHVFCHHKEKGCWWKGELSDFTQHVHSCQFRYLAISISFTPL